MACIFARTERKLEWYCKIKDNYLRFWVEEFLSWCVGEFISSWVLEFVSWWTCGFGVDGLVSLELMDLWVWSWWTCGFGVDELVGLELMNLWVWSWWTCEFGVDALVSWWVYKLVGYWVCKWMSRHIRALLGFREFIWLPILHTKNNYNCCFRQYPNCMMVMSSCVFIIVEELSFIYKP